MSRPGGCSKVSWPSRRNTLTTSSPCWPDSTRSAEVLLAGRAARARSLLVCGLCWLTVVIATLTLRPPFPVDETRCLAVAWRMHWSGDWLVPHLGEHPYSDKPPLLLWLINLGWSVFGVSETWARLVPMLFAPLAMLLTA